MTRSLTYFPAGRVSDYAVDTPATPTDPAQDDSEPFACKLITLPAPEPSPGSLVPLPAKKLAVFFRPDMGKFWAVNNICPHQGGSFAKGSLIDIEDFGIKWGVAVVCPLHSWSFHADNGECDRSRFVLDTHDVRVLSADGTTVEQKAGVIFSPDMSVEVSIEPKNKDVPGPRRDFGGVPLE
ncbi:hypothetical protein HK097_004025 [Rhizophlyctis rosea]|uniref:Rieske domain-containing protein n=1 Tax=Rhizophlyctis rosea TaxID=64517 RepID=A0AAD5XAH2_9FUNG|nr:hypothetical protein HK097_004025 [Rhizophlyctis rosea]